MNETDPRPALRRRFETLCVESTIEWSEVMWCLVAAAQEMGEGHEGAKQLALEIATEADEFTFEEATRHLQLALSTATLAVENGSLLWVRTGRTVPPNLRRRNLAISAFDHAKTTGKTDREAFDAAAQFDHQRTQRSPAVSAALRSHFGYGRDDYWRDPRVWDQLGYERTKRWYYGFLDLATNKIFIRESKKPLTRWRTEIRNVFGYEEAEIVEANTSANGGHRVDVFLLEEGADVVIPNWKNNIPPYGIAPDGRLGTWLKWVWQYVAMRDGWAIRGNGTTKQLPDAPAFTQAMVEARQWPSEPGVCLYAQTPSWLLHDI